MVHSLRSKISASFVIASLIGVFLISLVTNFYFEKQFTEYVKQSQEKKHSEILTNLSQQFGNYGKWDLEMVDSIGVNALESGFIIKVYDLKSSIIWDATVHNNGMCEKIIENMSHSGHETNKSYVEQGYPLTYKNNEIGKVVFLSFNDVYLSDRDRAFMDAFNKMILGVGAVSLVFAMLFGALMARRLSLPIQRVITSAKLISQGYFEDRVAEKSDTREIRELMSTVNELAENLQRQEILRKRLTADVAHELRTPLATLKSHLEAMIDGIWEADEKRLKGCYEEVERINKMVGDIEKLTKYEGEKTQIHKELHSVTQIVKNILSNFEIELKNKEIMADFFGEDIEVLVDKDRISQLFINLLSNAIKYSNSGGSIAVKVIRENGFAKVSVKDTGIGISKEDLPFVFERFYRADKSRNRATGGSGIGLTIAKAIVDAHDGRIDVESVVGEGTEFVVYLPIEG